LVIGQLLGKFEVSTVKALPDCTLGPGFLLNEKDFNWTNEQKQDNKTSEQKREPFSDNFLAILGCSRMLSISRMNQSEHYFSL